MDASIITIGDEILIGQIVDTNSAWLGEKLNELGVDVKQILSISDNYEAIKQTLRSQLEKHEIIFITGGLGPTKDDITKKCLVDFFDQTLEFDQELYDRISQYFIKKNIPMSDAHRIQCYMPSNIIQLQNNMGTAPGMIFEHQGKYVISMPGVPYEMKWIFENSFLPFYKSLNREELVIRHKTIRTVGKGESRIADSIQDIIDTFPTYMSIAFLPSLYSVRLRLTAKHKEDKTTELNAFATKISDRLGDIVYGYGTVLLEEALLDLFVEKKKTLSVAESCTGGSLASKLLSVPGASQYFVGGTIAYSNQVKRKELSVTEETMDNYGAVSEACVIEMTQGALEKYSTDLAISISGIAGPGGGTEEKPVGTIWLAYGAKGDIRTKKLQLSKDRKLNIQRTVVIAMDLIRQYLNE